MAPVQPTPAGGAPEGAGASTAAPPPIAGFDGVQQPTLGPYPPMTDAKPQGPAGGYPAVAPVSQQLPSGYPGGFGAAPAPAPYGPPYGAPGGAPHGAPPHGMVQMPMGPGGMVAPGGPEDKLGPMGMIAWGLFIVGIFFPFAWVICCFMPICAARSAKGPKDLMAVRRAAISSSIALCFVLVITVIFVSVGSSSWKRRVCTDRFGRQFYCA